MDDASSFDQNPNGMPPMNDMNQDAMAPMDAPTDEAPMEAESEPMDKESEELINLIDKLSIEDKAAAKKYIQSMVDDSESDNEEEGESNTDEPAQGQPMMETVTFTKGQLKKLNETKK